MSEPRKLRLLFLHGWSQNGKLASDRTGPLRRKLKHLADIYYPTAPHALPIVEGGRTNARSWFYYREDNREVPTENVGFDFETPVLFLEWEASKEYLATFVAEHGGPFDGVIGFSQGAVTAHQLCLESLLDPSTATLPGIKFAILVAGFPTIHAPTHAASLAPLPLPSLHISSENDTTVPPSLHAALVTRFDPQRSVVLQHDKGHQMPHDAPTLQEVARWCSARRDEILGSEFSDASEERLLPPPTPVLGDGSSTGADTPASGEESFYFGPLLGERRLLCCADAAFNDACSSKNDADCTGLRVYAGNHISIRLLAAHPLLLHSTPQPSASSSSSSPALRGIELGCGTGALGVLTMLSPALAGVSVLLTDGNPEAVRMAEHNARLAGLPPSRALAAALNWTTCEAALQALLRDHNDSRPFDFVLGSELFYYRTLPAELLATVRGLVDPKKGVFVHTHLFRVRSQAAVATLVLETLASWGWATAEVLLDSFISAEELGRHAEWLGCRCLVSGAAETLDARLRHAGLRPGAWRAFDPSKMDGLPISDEGGDVDPAPFQLLGL